MNRGYVQMYDFCVCLFILYWYFDTNQISNNVDIQKK